MQDRQLVAVSARNTGSVISSSSRRGDKPECASAEMTTCTRLRLRNCTGGNYDSNKRRDG
jgi:hypothetical protein